MACGPLKTLSELCYPNTGEFKLNERVAEVMKTKCRLMDDQSEEEAESGYRRALYVTPKADIADIPPRLLSQSLGNMKSTWHRRWTLAAGWQGTDVPNCST